MDKRENCLKLCLALRLLVLLLMSSAESRVAASVLVVILALPCFRSPEDYWSLQEVTVFAGQFLSCVWSFAVFFPHISLVHLRFCRAEPVLWSGGEKSPFSLLPALLFRYLLN